MVDVSTQYKKEIAQSLRNRGYMLVTVGLINQDAQNNANITDNGIVTYSQPKNVLLEKSLQQYATFEEDFCRIDNSMILLPYNNDTNYMQTEYVSDFIEEPYIMFNFNKYEDIKGITINFGNDYPLDFSLETDNGIELNVTNNTEQVYITENVFSHISYMKIVFKKMKNEKTRSRINHVTFGYGLSYTNENITDAKLYTKISPIGENLPQIDFKLTLTNYDRYFDVDNPSSAIYFFETGQKIELSYGYELNSGEIEWIKGGVLECTEWVSDESSVTISATDILRQKTENFYMSHAQTDRSFYEIAYSVMINSRITDFYIDPRLKQLKTASPLPLVSQKEMLQLIANGSRCTLRQDRDGKVSLFSRFEPDRSATTNGELYYSDVNEIFTDDNKFNYGTFSEDYTKVNNDNIFLYEVGEERKVNGFVSKYISDENGYFDTNPTINITQEAIISCDGVRIEFKEICKSFTITTYIGNSIIETFDIVNNNELSYTLNKTLLPFEKMELVIKKTGIGNNRASISFIKFGDVSTFLITSKDIIPPMKANKLENIRSVTVPYYTYTLSDKGLEQVYEKTITVSDNETVKIFFDSPYANVTVESPALPEINGIHQIDAGEHYVWLAFEHGGTFDLKLTGTPYIVSSQQVSKILRNDGKDILWENPLIDNKTDAEDLLDWLVTHYESPVSYEYNTRGNPEIDANDIVFQYNHFLEKSKVIIEENDMLFQQGFSGRLKTRRIS